MTGAVVFRYAPDASGTTNYEVSLLLDGTTWEDLTEGFGYEVYFDLYFDGAVDELVPGEYVFSDAGVFRDGVYSGHSSTEDVGYDVVAGTLTVGKDGNGWSFSFDGSAASEFDPDNHEPIDVTPFRCSYSGSVTYMTSDSE